MGKTDDKAEFLAKWFRKERIPLMFFDRVVAKAKAILEESHKYPEVSEKKRQKKQAKKI